MDSWIAKYRERLEALGVKVWLLKKYVDDVLIVTTNLQMGARVIGDQVIVTEQSKTEDESNCRSVEEVTMNVLKGEANKIINFLEFTAEVSKGRDAPVACLDTQLWYGPS